jgi:nucleoside recognition membrane protein YjiH
MRVSRFLISSAVGLAFFALPLSVGERVTVPFDLVVKWILSSAPGAVGMYCLVLILAGAGGSLAALLAGRESKHRWLGRYRTSTPLVAIRLLAVPLALAYSFRAGPDLLLQPTVSGLMWSTLAFSVGVIVPIGAALLVLLVRYGLLEFIGTLMRPIMRPIFRLPGRSALDSLTSWIGSYSVGLYLTRRLMQEGFYNRQEAYIIVTCFSTVSVGFVAVVAQTLGILHLFPQIFLTYFVAVYLLTALLARTWPVTRISEDYVTTPQPEVEVSGGVLHLAREAWSRALRQAGEATGVIRTLRDGFVDGLILASTILGSILTVGTLALLVARETPLFHYLGRPLVPVLSALGFADADIIAPATLVGIAEMYIPALLVREATLPSRFFIAILSVSQLIFFSAVGSMMIDMFREIPVRARELVALFLMRTAVLVPFLAAITTLLKWAGVLG